MCIIVLLCIHFHFNDLPRTGMYIKDILATFGQKRAEHEFCMCWDKLMIKMWLKLMLATGSGQDSDVKLEISCAKSFARGL